jgi:enoyl-[acyl-carrier protein] reductase II
LHNPFFEAVVEAEQRGDSPEQLRDLLGRGRAKKGMFEGDLTEGELEIGQVSGSIHGLKPAAEIVADIERDYRALTAGMTDPHFQW